MLRERDSNPIDEVHKELDTDSRLAELRNAAFQAPLESAAVTGLPKRNCRKSKTSLATIPHSWDKDGACT